MLAKCLRDTDERIPTLLESFLSLGEEIVKSLNLVCVLSCFEYERFFS